MAVQTDGCGIALLRKSPPSIRSLVGLLFGLADDVWNWLFTVARRFPLEKVVAWIREWGSTLNIERRVRGAVWKGSFITCGVFSQFITVFTSDILAENKYDNIYAVKNVVTQLCSSCVYLCFIVGNP